jgi:hypothetical protein
VFIDGVTFVDVWVSFSGLPKHPVQRDDKRSFPQRTGGTGFLEKVSCALPSSGFDKTSLPVLPSYPGGSFKSSAYGNYMPSSDAQHNT